MKINSFLVFTVILFCYSFKVNAQQAFTVHVVPSSISSAPAVHSGAFALRDGKWIFIGGRLDGIHSMQGGSAFPLFSRNDSIFVVDPFLDTCYAASAHQFPAYLFEALCSTNMEYYQD